MNNRDIEWRKGKLEQMRIDLESGQLNAIREMIPNEVIEGICEECGYDFRARLLTPLVTIFQMIQAGLSRDGSFQSAWHLNGQTGKSGSLAKARKRLPLKIWTELHEWMMAQLRLETTAADLWRGPAEAVRGDLRRTGPRHHQRRQAVKGLQEYLILNGRRETVTH